MEIIAKFGSALSGFWWSLDEHERKLLIIGGAYLVAVVLYTSTAQERRERELEELAARLEQRLRNG